MLAAVSTEHKIGMLVVAGIFIAFALSASFLFPRYRPQFPGRNGLGAFIAASVALFVAMMLAVEFFAVEEEEAEAGTEAAAVEEQTTTARETTATTATTETGTTETGTTETQPTAPATTAARPRTISVSGTEFAFALAATELEPGSYVFRLRNEGQVPHDLAIEGPGVEGAKTPVIDPGATADVDVELRSGDYELWCTVPGHRDAGMETEVSVS